MKLKANFDKVGVVGLLVTALFSPCCFPLFAFAFSALGLGSAELFGGWTEYIFQGMVLLSLTGLFFAYRKHKNVVPFSIGLAGGGLIFYTYNVSFNFPAIYIGMAGVFMATFANYFINRRQKAYCTTCVVIEEKDEKMVEIHSTITCPSCGYQRAEIMPENSCYYFYICLSCEAVLKPKQGDCCVYCSYGSVRCPPTQLLN